MTGEKQTAVAAYGSFFSTLRDYARFGLMAMRGGQLGEERVVGKRWIEASSITAPFAKPRLDRTVQRLAGRRSAPGTPRRE